MGLSCAKPSDSLIFLIQDMKIKTKKILAQGGYGFVYLAEDLKTKKKFALKVVELPSHEQRLVFQREIEAMVPDSLFQRLMGDHPNIIKMHSAEQKQEWGFILMEKARYTLWQKLSLSLLNPLSEEEIIYILREVTSGLKHIHTKGYAHRDIKAENILILPDGGICICDFGSCTNEFMNSLGIPQEQKGIYEEQYGKYTTGIYKPPELVDLNLGYRIDQKMDMWMLGCLLYVLCYYKAPFAGEKEILKADFQIPRDSRFSKELNELLLMLLRPNPQQRPTASEVLKRLNTFTMLKSTSSSSGRGSGSLKSSR